MKLPMKRYYPAYKNQKAKVEHMERSSLKSIICELSAYSLCCRDIDCFWSKVVFLGWTRRSYRHTNYSHRGETCSAVNEQHVQSKKSEMKWMTMMLGWLPSLTSLRALRTNTQVICARSHRQCSLWRPHDHKKQNWQWIFSRFPRRTLYSSRSSFISRRMFFSQW